MLRSGIMSDAVKLSLQYTYRRNLSFPTNTEQIYAYKCLIKTDIGFICVRVGERARIKPIGRIQ
jgi:hypothetical protein